MTDLQLERHVKALRDIICEYAPSEAMSLDRLEMVNQVDECISSQLRVWRGNDGNHEKCLLAVVNILYDGLAWGNWRWTTPAREFHAKAIVRKPKKKP